MTELKIHSIRFLTESLFELELERTEMAFEPGSCIAVFNPQRESRPYSIASGIGESVLRLLIRRIQGGQISAWLANCQPGDGVTVSAPFGWFRPAGAQADEKRVYFATGTGIAPFLSCLRSRPAAQPGTLSVWRRQANGGLCPDGNCNASPGSAWRPRKNNETNTFTVASPGSSTQVPLAADIHYYLCGLDSMIDEISTWLENQGIDFTQIHREIFFYEN